MSQENVEIVRRMYDSYAERGAERAADFFSDDHVAYAVPEWPDDPEYHGVDGIQKLSDEWTDNFDDFGFEVHELRDTGETVVALVEMTGVVKGTTAPIRQPVGAVHRDFRGERIGETRYFLSWREALEAVGLSE